MLFRSFFGSPLSTFSLFSCSFSLFGSTSSSNDSLNGVFIIRVRIRVRDILVRNILVRNIFIIRSLLCKLLRKFLEVAISARELGSLVAAEHELFTEASLRAASGDGEGLFSVLSDNLVGVIDIDGDPLW